MTGNNYSEICKSKENLIMGLDALNSLQNSILNSAKQEIYENLILKAKHSNAIFALKLLLSAKEMKDKEGKTELYENIKDIAWSTARLVLENEYKNDEKIRQELQKIVDSFLGEKNFTKSNFTD